MLGTAYFLFLLSICCTFLAINGESQRPPPKPHRLRQALKLDEDMLSRAEETTKQKREIRLDVAPNCPPPPPSQKPTFNHDFFFENMSSTYRIAISDARDDGSGIYFAARELTRAIELKGRDELSYDFLKRQIDLLASWGLVSTVREFTSKESVERPYKQYSNARQIIVTIGAASGRLNTVPTPTGPCGLATSWPLSWVLKDTQSKRTSKIDVHALPATRAKDGSYKILVQRSKLNWKVVGEANRKFVESNNFRLVKDDKEVEDIRTTSIFVGVSGEILNCTESYFHEICPLFTTTTRLEFCSKWGITCGIHDAIELDEPFGKATHMLYIAARVYGSIIPNASRILSETGTYVDRTLDTKSSYRQALITTEQSSFTAALEELTTFQNVRSIYIPKLEEEQNEVTFLIIFLSFCAEWVLSNPVWAWKVYTKIARSTFKIRKRDLSEKAVKKGAWGTKSRYLQQCVLILPAIIGMVPIGYGLALSREREEAKVGLLYATWSKKPYLALNDPRPGLRDSNMGSAVGLTMMYSEDSGFKSLGHRYLIALCVASILMVYSIIPLLLTGYRIWRRDDVKGASPSHQDCSDCGKFHDSTCPPRSRGLDGATDAIRLSWDMLAN